MSQTTNMEFKNLPPATEMYEALVSKDSSFEGIFFAAIKTTGIFCRPTCSARKPKRENVEYFPTTKDALANGYRPCKKCHPMESFGETPSWLKPLLEEIQQDPGITFKDYALKQRGIDPARIRRWFKKHHGMTFQAYLRSLRINKAFGQIKHKDTVINSAFESGFNSLSAFNEAFKKTTGFTPLESRNRTLVTITRVLSPLGPLLTGATDEGICLLEFTDRRMLETQIQRLRKSLNAEFAPGNHPLLDKLSKQLEEYFAGTRKTFDIPLVLTGTDFQKSVWDVLMTIPYGETRAYQDQANAINNPKAVRAVARSNGDNKISIIIPCHRVIGKDGSLTGYGGGLWRKKFLLELEGTKLKPEQVNLNL